MSVTEWLDKFLVIDYNLGIKFFASATTVLIAFKNLRRYFINSSRRNHLKSDLEIYKQLQESNLEITAIKHEIDRTVNLLYKNKARLFSSSPAEVVGGLLLFFGFGFWTLALYNENNGFSPWAILTSLLCIAGLSNIFQEREAKSKKKKSDPSFTLSLYSWRSFIMGISIVILSVGAIFWIYVSSGFSFWQLIPGVVIMAGIAMIFDEIEITSGKKAETVNV
ncbi:MAG TPA: hypothetical protein VK508_04720 [Cyclobacteriaceae bacterium]|nr:hypothetical protein [Cyclobacteriaceae bacterium]